MTDHCPDCGSPIATRMPCAISPKGPCARNWHPVGADDCMALTLDRLRLELAEAKAASWREGYDAALDKESPVHRAAEAHWLALALEGTGKLLAKTASEFAGDNAVALKMTRAFAAEFASGIAEMAAAERKRSVELISALPEPANPYCAVPPRDMSPLSSVAPSNEEAVEQAFKNSAFSGDQAREIFRHAFACGVVYGVPVLAAQPATVPMDCECALETLATYFADDGPSLYSQSELRNARDSIRVALQSAESQLAAAKAASGLSTAAAQQLVDAVSSVRDKTILTYDGYGSNAGVGYKLGCFEAWVKLDALLALRAAEKPEGGA